MTILNQYYYVLCSVKCRVPDSGDAGDISEKVIDEDRTNYFRDKIKLKKIKLKKKLK